MHGKYSFVETLIERLIQQVRKHEKQVKAYDEAFFVDMRYDPSPSLADYERYAQREAAVTEWAPDGAGVDVTDANPERRGNGCMVYRVNGGTDAS